MRDAARNRADDVTKERSPVTSTRTAFAETLAAIRPAPHEVRWQEIRWETDLRDACAATAEQGRPIFLWAMNGNPLGCT